MKHVTLYARLFFVVTIITKYTKEMYSLFLDIRYAKIGERHKVTHDASNFAPLTVGNKDQANKYSKLLKH